MWIPANEQELLDALARADLVETASFDGKRDLPAQGESASLAVDVVPSGIRPSAPACCSR
jgi:hypothetical protein